MSLPWRPELQQVRTRSGCETLRRRLRVKWHRKSEYAFRTPLWVLGTQPELKTTLFQEGFAISGKEFRSRQSVRLRSRAIWAASLHAGRPGREATFGIGSEIRCNSLRARSSFS